LFACGGPNTDFADEFLTLFLSSLNFQFNDIKGHPVKTGLDYTPARMTWSGGDVVVYIPFWL
jgi:hypothetical protein